MLSDHIQQSVGFLNNRMRTCRHNMGIPYSNLGCGTRSTILLSRLYFLSDQEVVKLQPYKTQRVMWEVVSFVEFGQLIGVAHNQSSLKSKEE